MLQFASFLALVIIGVVINRVMAWGRRADARHRARFIAAGYLENFPSFRLREDQRKRIALVAWVIFAGLPLLFNHQHPFHPVNVLMVLATNFGGMIFAIIPAIVLRTILFHYVERTNEKGLFVINMLIKKFHQPIKKLEVDGSHGTAEEASLAEIGLINLQGMQTKGFMPIVPDDKKDGAK